MSDQSESAAIAELRKMVLKLAVEVAVIKQLQENLDRNVARLKETVGMNANSISLPSHRARPWSLYCKWFLS